MPVKQSNEDGNIDPHGFAPLKNELEKRIPEDAPEWTDHNTHDPGQTILPGILGRIFRLFRRIFSGNELPSDLETPSTEKTNKSNKSE